MVDPGITEYEDAFYACEEHRIKDVLNSPAPAQCFFKSKRKQDTRTDHDIESDYIPVDAAETARDAGVAPGDCVVIEDSASGAQAGKAAGMQVFGFAAETPRERLAPICDLVFEDMAALPGLLGLS